MKITIKNKNLCKRYCAWLVKDVSIGESDKKIKQYLRDCGLRSINNIVDLTNFIMLETGQPLHAFDADKIDEIIIRQAKKGEKINALDDKTYNLDGSVLVIADKKEPLAIAGIKGGKKASITKQTKNIILEAGNFDSVCIRYSSKKLKLITDASYRFERGVDIELPPVALQRVVDLLGQGKLTEKKDIYPKEYKPAPIFFDFNQELADFSIKPDQAKKILKSLGFKILSKNEVLPPSWRSDVQLNVDVLEKI